MKKNVVFLLIYGFWSQFFFVPIKLKHIVHNYLQPISLLHAYDIATYSARKQDIYMPTVLELSTFNLFSFSHISR